MMKLKNNYIKGGIVLILLLIIIVTYNYCIDSKYIGLDKLMNYTIPKDYTVEKNVIYNDNNELISIHYGKNNTSIYLILLCYNDKAVMGSDGGLSEWFREGIEIDKTYEIDKTNTPGVCAYIYYPNDIGTTDMIESVFSYKDYLVMVGMTNYNGDYLTKEEISTFYNLLDSIRFLE